MVIIYLIWTVKMITTIHLNL